MVVELIAGSAHRDRQLSRNAFGQFAERVFHLLAVAVGDRGGPAFTRSATGPLPAPSPCSDADSLSRTSSTRANSTGVLVRFEPDGVVVLQCRTAAVGRGQLDLAVGEDGVGDGDRLHIGGHRDVLVDGELDLDVPTPWR